tara:strand:+ start:60 stop:452 length:393 start_codon:yes stop_codon:yes gene_type:complete
MKLTKEQLKQIIKEELAETYYSNQEVEGSHILLAPPEGAKRISSLRLYKIQKEQHEEGITYYVDYGGTRVYLPQDAAKGQPIKAPNSASGEQYTGRTVYGDVVELGQQSMSVGNIIRGRLSRAQQQQVAG